MNIESRKTKLHRIIKNNILVGKNKTCIFYLMMAGRWEWAYKLAKGEWNLRNPKRLLRLHLGCGRRHLDGYVNIDLNLSKATDYVGDIKKLPCPNDSSKRIECYHVIEHISHKKVKKYVKEWHRVLVEGGELVIECPNFDKTIDEYMSGKEERIFNIYGRQRFPGDTHKFGYNRNRLKNLLKECGFEKVVSERAKDYHSEEEPCIREVAYK
jgi:predicted SAM-dependent methyltransferase